MRDADLSQAAWRTDQYQFKLHLPNLGSAACVRLVSTAQSKRHESGGTGTGFLLDSLRGLRPDDRRIWIVTAHLRLLAAKRFNSFFPQSRPSL